LYRRTLKKFRPAHQALHGLARHGVIPALEMASSFKTMPDDPLWFRLELLTGRHERETLAQVERLLRPGMTVLDVGAHVGYYARRCARAVGTEGVVIAFEPHPRTFKVLMKNVSRMQNVRTAQLAVADHEGTAELYDYLMMSASGSLHYDESLRDLQRSQVAEGDVAPRIAQDFPVETFSVRTTTIDTLLDELEIGAVDLVKMDIEGGELPALRGMSRTLERSPNLALIMEYNPQALKATGPEAAVAEVLALGFRRMQSINADGTLTDLTGDDARLSRLTADLMARMDVVNLLFTR
jgi:FkbM family methyltransferase